MTMTMPLRSLAVAVCVAGLAGCPGTAVPLAPADAQGPRDGPNPATVAVASHVAGVQATTLQRVPEPGSREALSNNCRNQAIEPRTPGGKAAHAQGWTVTSEAALGPYTAVGVFSQGQDSTSGICLIADGRITVWQDAQPLAMVNDRPVTDAHGATRTRTNVVTATANAPPSVRIWDGTGAGPLADLIVAAHGGLQVQPIAAQDSVCNARHVIPNVYGHAVADAREALAAHGWQPQPPEQGASSIPHDRAADYRAQGWVEFETCSGTGMGYCALNYRHADGSRLMVTAMGEPASVVNWSVQCR